MGMREGQFQGGCHGHCCEQGLSCPRGAQSLSPSSSTVLLKADLGVMDAPLSGLLSQVSSLGLDMDALA